MDEVTKQWSLCGRQVDCTYREKAVPDDKVRITGSWSCGRYENLKIRSTVKKEPDVEQYLKRQIEKQLMAYLRKEQAGVSPEPPERSPTLMELYRQKYRQYFNEHDWLPPPGTITTGTTACGCCAGIWKKKGRGRSPRRILSGGWKRWQINPRKSGPRRKAGRRSG